MSKKSLVKVRLVKSGNSDSIIKANNDSVYQVEDVASQIDSIKVVRKHNDLLISNQKTGESLMLKDYFEKTDVSLILQGEGDKAGLWMLDSGANLTSSTDLSSVLVPVSDSSGAFWGGLDWPLLELLLPVTAGVGLALSGDSGDNGDNRTVLNTPSARLSLDSGVSAADTITNSGALTVSPLQEGATRTYSINGGTQTSSYASPTTDGVYTVVITDRMTDGQIASTTVTFTLDTTIAVPSIVLSQDTGSSATDAMTNDASVTAAGAPAADVVRTYSINGGAPSSSYVAPTADGTYTVTVTDTDAAGNSASASTTFTLDKTIATPTISLVSDSGVSNSDGLTNNAALNVSAAAADVTRTYVVNGGAPSSSYVAPTTDGTYTVTVTDTDTAGNTATSAVTFTLDTTIPVAQLTLSLLNDSGRSNTDLITYNGETVADGYEIPENIRWSINGSEWMTLDAFNAYGATLPDGIYTVKVIESDAAGNTTPEASITFTLDRIIEQPTLSIDPASAAGADLSTTYPTLVEQVPTDIDVRTYTLFNETTQASTELTGTFNMPTEPGFYDVTTTYTDIAGNQATSNIFAFYIGSAASNVAYGSDVSTTMIGGAGDDSLYGKGGVDLIYGGSGNDDIYINTDNLNQLLNGMGLINGGTQTDALHIEDVVAKFSLDSLVNVVKGIEIIQFDQSSPIDGLGVSAAAVQAIAEINGIGQSSNFSSTVLDASKYQMAFGASTGGGITLDVGNASEWIDVGTALYDNTAVMHVYNHLTLPVQIIL